MKEAEGEHVAKPEEWDESVASDSEAVVKAEISEVTDVHEMQRVSVEKVKVRVLWGGLGISRWGPREVGWASSPGT